MSTMTHVHYAVKAEYAAQNQRHISRVIDELRALHRTDIKYSVFVEEDGKTFMHMLLCANEEAEKAFGMLESQQEFQAALQESRPEGPLTMTSISLVGSSYNLF